jgi:hypothetical protein
MTSASLARVVALGAWSLLGLVVLSSLFSQWRVCVVLVEEHRNITTGRICTAVDELSKMPLTASECSGRRRDADYGVVGCIHHQYYESFIGAFSRFADNQPIDGFYVRVLFGLLAAMLFPYGVVPALKIYFDSENEKRRIVYQEERDRFNQAQQIEAKNQALQISQLVHDLGTSNMKID